MTSRVASFHALALFIAIPVTLASAQQKIPLPAGCGAGSTFDSCFHQHAVVAHENGISTKPLQGKLLEDYPVDGPIGISFDNNEATALTDQALITCPPASKCFAEIDVSIQLDDLQPEDPVYNTFAAFVLLDGSISNILPVNVISVENMCNSGTSVVRSIAWRTGILSPGIHTILPAGFATETNGYAGSFSRKASIKLYKVD